MSSGLYKAVCYRCAHVAPVTANRCPACQFPMILEPEGTPPGGRRIEEIFARDSLRDGAPPLPGVHVEKRQAQIMAEARRERVATQRHPRQPRVSEFSPPEPESVKIPRFRYSTLKLTLFCASAVAAGVVAAAIQSGAL